MICDMFVPAAPGSLMRAANLSRCGKTRISRRDAELYSVQILSAGAWAHFKVTDGHGRPLFQMCSTFVGSFWLSAGAKDGIILDVEQTTIAPTVTINFREKDTKVV